MLVFIKKIYLLSVPGHRNEKCRYAIFYSEISTHIEHLQKIIKKNIYYAEYELVNFQINQKSIESKCAEILIFTHASIFIQLKYLIKLCVNKIEKCFHGNAQKLTNWNLAIGSWHEIYIST